MSGFYEKTPFCMTCRNKQMADEYELKAHQALGHVTEYYTTGGYRKGPEEIQPLPSKAVKAEPKIDLDLAEMEEDAVEPEEELGI